MTDRLIRITTALDSAAQMNRYERCLSRTCVRAICQPGLLVVLWRY
jgi:hypothetical protein